MNSSDKRKRGRPFVAEDERAHTIGVSVPSATAKLLRTLQTRTKVPTSALMRAALKHFLGDEKAYRAFVTEYRMKKG